MVSSGETVRVCETRAWVGVVRALAAAHAGRVVGCHRERVGSVDREANTRAENDPSVFTITEKAPSWEADAKIIRDKRVG